MSELLELLRTDMVSAKARQAEREPGSRPAAQMAFERWFRQSCAEGRPPDALDKWIEDEYERFMTRTIQGIDGHVYWTSRDHKFMTNDRKRVGVRRWWWFHLNGACGDRMYVMATCGEVRCIAPHHCRAIPWAEHRRLESDEQIIGKLQVLAMRLGRTPTTREIVKVMNVKTLRKRFGSFNEALIRAGLEPRVVVRKKVSTDQVLAEVRAEIGKLGYVPTRAWWRLNVRSPSHYLLETRFGSYTKAMKEATK